MSFNVCRFFQELPKDVRDRIVPALVQLAYRKYLKRGDLDRAYQVIYEAVEMGYDSVLTQAKERLGTLIEFRSVLEALNNDVRKLMSSEKVDDVLLQVFRNDLERATDLFLKVSQYLPSDLRERIRRSLLAFRDLYDFLNIVKKYSHVVDEYRSIANELTSLGEASPEKLWNLANRLAKLLGEVRKVVNEVYGWNPRSEEMKDVKFKLMSKINTVEGTVRRLQNLLALLANLFDAYNELGELLSSYGTGTNYLKNSGYRSRVVNALYRILINLKRLDSLVGEYRYGMDEIDNIALDIVTRFRKALDKLKEEYVSSDVRWNDVFEEAEKLAGFELTDVHVDVWSALEKTAEILDKLGHHDVAEAVRAHVEYCRRNPNDPACAIEKWSAWSSFEPYLSAWIRDVYETNALMVKRGVMPIMSHIGVVGAGALDALTLLLRPRAMYEQLLALKHIFDTFNECCKRYGINGIGVAFRRIASEMFRDENDLLYFIGQVLVAFAISKLVGRLPLPRWARSVLENVAQGDPLGLCIGLVTDVTPILRNKIFARIVKEGDVVRVLEASHPEIREFFSFDDVAKSIAEKGTRIYGYRFLSDLVHELRNILANSRTFSEVARKTKELLQKQSISEIAKLKQSYFDVLRRFNELLSPEYVRNVVKVSVGVREEVLKQVLGIEVPRIELKVSGITSRGIVPSAESIEVASRRIAEVKDFVRNVRKTIEETKSFLEQLGKRLGIDVAPYIARLDEVAKGLPSVSRLEKVLADVRNVLQKEIAKMLPEDLRARFSDALRRIDEALKKMRTASGREFKILRTEIEKAYREIEDVLREASARAVFVERLRKRIAGILRENGFENVARKIENSMTVSDVLNELKRFFETEARKHGLKAYEALDKALKVLGEFVKKHPELKALFEAVENLSIEVKARIASARMGEAILSKNLATNLLSALKEASESVVNAKLRKALAGAMNELRKAIASGRGISLRKIEEIVAKLEKLCPEIEAVTDLVAMKSVLQTINDVLRKAMGSATEESVRKAISSLMKRIEKPIMEIEQRIKAELVPPGFVEAINEAKQAFARHISPEFASEFSQVAEKMLSELREGKLSEETVKQMEKLLKKLRWSYLRATVSKNVVSALEKLSKALSEYIGGMKVPSPVRNLLTEFATVLEDIRRDIVTAPPENYVYAFVEAEEKLARVKPAIFVDPKKLQQVERFFRYKIDTWMEIDIGGKRYRLHVRKIPITRPDGSRAVIYEISTPDGRWVRIRFEIKPAKVPPEAVIGAGEIYVPVRTLTFLEYDPRIVDSLRKGDPFAEMAIERATELLSRVDRTFDPELLRRVVILDPRARFVDLFTVITRATRASAPILFVVGSVEREKLSPDQRAWLAALACEKERFLADVSRIAKPVTDRVLIEELKKRGLLPIAVLPTKPEIVIVEPISMPKISVEHIGTIVWKGERIIVPVIKIAGKEIGVLPNVDIDIEEIEREASKLREVPVERIDVEELRKRLEKMRRAAVAKPTTRRTTMGAVAKGTAPMPTMPLLSLYVVSGGRKGLQLEKLVL